jgi:hypothetical protein
MIGRKYLLAALLFFSTAVGASVQVNVDRTALSINDSFTLVLRATSGENLRNTDFRLLQQDFTIESSSQRTNIVTSNGKTERVEELHITMSPKRQGNLVVPSLKVDGFVTDPIQLTVKQSRKDLFARDLFFVEAQLSKKTAYVSEQVLLYVRVYQAVVIDNLSATPLSLENVDLQRIGSNTFNRSIDGINYKVTESILSLAAHDSGVLTIPALQFEGRQMTQGSDFFSRGKQVKRRSDPLQLYVQPIPAGFPSRDWLPAEELILSEDWSADLGSLKVGDSITRTLTIRANGLSGPQLPPVEAPNVAGVKIYPDQPKTETITASSGISALGVNSSAWVVTEPGHFQVPAIEFPWWDTQQDKLRYARIPARTLSVAPGATPTLSNQPKQNPAAAHENVDSIRSPGVWAWLSAGLAVLWLLTLLLLLRQRRGPSQITPKDKKTLEDQNKLFSQLDKSCRENKPQQCREQLQQLVTLLLPQLDSPALSGLEDLGVVEMAPALSTLNHHLFAGDSQGDTWSGVELRQALKLLRARVNKTGAPADLRDLPPLYNTD